jgi:hypothetical protein
MKIESILILMSFFILPLNTDAQDSYQVLFRNSKNESVNSMIQDKNGSIIAVGKSNVFDSQRDTYRGKVWKINSAIDTLSMQFTFGDTSSSFNYIEELANGNYLLGGNIFLPPDYNNGLLIFLEVTKSFEKVKQKTICIEGWTNIYAELTKKFSENYYLLGSVFIDNYIQSFIIKTNSDLDTLSSRVYTNATGTTGQFMDCILSPDSSQLWTFTDGFTPGGSAADDIFIYDTLLNFVKCKSFPFVLNPVTVDIDVEYQHNMTVRWLTDSTFLVGCNHLRTYNQQQDLEYDIGFSEMDSALLLVPITYFGSNDTTDYAPFLHATFDFRTSDSIVFSGTKRQISEFWPHKPSWIKAGMFNRNMQPIYDNYYGGDAYYKALIIKCTSDGGSMIAANRYDYLTQNSERDVFFLKLNNVGLITGEAENEICPFSVFNVYPNPSHSSFKITLIVEKAGMKLYNLSGTVVLQKQIIEGENLINSSSLIAGTYICEIITQKGELFRKKIVIL